VTMTRVCEIAADVVLGLILAIFVYAVIAATWKSLHGPVVLVPVLILCVFLTLFRRPNGSLARRLDD
jgi:hypothetical protein